MICVRNTNDIFLDRIVTCDKNWILYDYVNDRDEFPKPKLHQQTIIVTVW